MTMDFHSLRFPSQEVPLAPGRQVGVFLPLLVMLLLKSSVQDMHKRIANYKQGDFFGFFFLCIIQHCFICRPSDSTVSEDAGIEPRTVAS